MVSEDEHSDSGPAGTPTWRRCLTLMDKLFPPPEPDGRLEMIVSIIADTVTEHGYAEMWHVPGDQQAALRSQARKAVKQPQAKAFRDWDSQPRRLRHDSGRRTTVPDPTPNVSGERGQPQNRTRVAMPSVRVVDLSFARALCMASLSCGRTHVLLAANKRWWKDGCPAD